MLTQQIALGHLESAVTEFVIVMELPLALLTLPIAGQVPHV